MMKPMYSPWGEIQHCEMLTPHVFSVSTASHGGIMVNARAAKTIFSKDALNCAFRNDGFYCFEEDCDAPVAIRELMDRRLFTAPVNAYWKPGEYENCIDASVQRYHSDYWEVRETGTAVPAIQKTNKECIR